MKGHETFLRAASEFAKIDPQARFVCVGGGAASYIGELKAQALSLGLDSCLVWAGERTDARSANNAFDIAVSSSSYGEGFSNAICEAMACGVPVAATAVGDAAAIVGETGEVVPPGRALLLAAAWVRLRHRLAQNPDLGATARARILANFSVNAMVLETEAVLLRVSGQTR